MGNWLDPPGTRYAGGVLAAARGGLPGWSPSGIFSLCRRLRKCSSADAQIEKFIPSWRRVMSGAPAGPTAARAPARPRNSRRLMSASSFIRRHRIGSKGPLEVPLRCCQTLVDVCFGFKTGKAQREQNVFRFASSRSGHSQSIIFEGPLCAI
jgi:hypothetical protein